MGKRAMGNGAHVIKVQPLKRSEMQVRCGDYSSQTKYNADVFIS